MELEYEKKEITASPKTKAVKPVWVIKDGYDYEYLDEVIVKGKTEPIKIYTIRK